MHLYFLQPQAKNGKQACHNGADSTFDQALTRSFGIVTNNQCRYTNLDWVVVGDRIAEVCKMDCIEIAESRRALIEQSSRISLYTFASSGAEAVHPSSRC